MRKRKLRGKKRQLRMIEQRLKEATSVFPTLFYNGIHSIKLPANQVFIEGLKQKGVASINNYFMDCAMTLKQSKSSVAYKIVVLIFPENMWRSELLIFENEQVYREFLAVHTHTGFWLEQKAPLPPFTCRHWTQKLFIESSEDAGKQMIICTIER